MGCHRILVAQMLHILRDQEGEDAPFSHNPPQRLAARTQWPNPHCETLLALDNSSSIAKTLMAVW